MVDRKRPEFNVRVYGICFDSARSKILLSEEEHAGTRLLKFPGGGLEHKEAPEDGLKREFREEAGVNVYVKDFFYASKSFHKSYFRESQMIGLYWLVELAERESFLGHKTPVFTDKKKEHSFRLYWQDLSTLCVENFTTDLDREVAREVCASVIKGPTENS